MTWSSSGVREHFILQQTSRFRGGMLSCNSIYKHLYHLVQIDLLSSPGSSGDLNHMTEEANQL